MNLTPDSRETRWAHDEAARLTAAMYGLRDVSGAERAVRAGELLTAALDGKSATEIVALVHRLAWTSTAAMMALLAGGLPEREDGAEWTMLSLLDVLDDS